MSKKSPLVSVIMPVYNAELYLRETLDSILRQTFTNFELIAINDGSKDGSGSILDEYATRDSRLVVIHQENKGLVTTLNESITKAKGQYIARVDADDPSFDDRLSLQVDVLESRPDTVLVGGGFEIIDEHGYFIETVHTPTRDEDVRRTMLLRNPFGHAGVMYRKDTFLSSGGYSEKHGPTEDMELWIRLSNLGEISSIPKPIYKYRILAGGISQSNAKIQAEYTERHLDNLWRSSTPRLLTRRELFIQSHRYLEIGPQLHYSVGLKEQFLSDNAQIGIKLIRYKHFTQGIKQLIAVASIGRTGIRAVVKRLRALDLGSFKRAVK